MNIYGQRDHEEQGEHYMRHLDRMTREKLHDKSAIAGELAHRDILIEQLRKAVALARPELHALYFQLTHKRLEKQDNTDCVKRAVDALDAAVDATKTTVP